MTATSKLNQLEETINRGEWRPRNCTLFAGADVCVSENEPDKRSESVTYVVTEHAPLISALMRELADICSDYIDYLSKYYFYESLADTANNALDAGLSFKELAISMVECARVGLPENDGGLYFAYGSNMSHARMKDRCEDAYLIGKCIMRDYKFELDETGAATLVRVDGAVSYGLLWRISEDDETNLDRCEGVSNNCYDKQQLEVEALWGNVQALAYLSNRGHDQGVRREGYLDMIVEAAREAEFPDEYVRYLESFER